MDLIILPGNSKQYNEQWLYDSAAIFKNDFDGVTTHVFEHWLQNKDSADLSIESKKLKNEVEGKSNFVIYAKSVGTVTTIKAIVELGITPQACIFVGSPFNEFEEVKNWIKKYDIHTLFIQQTDDPFFKYCELEKFIEDNELKNYELVEIPGSNHAYDNYKDIRQLVLEFLN